MNRSGAPADCWLLCMIHASYILKHLSCEALAGNVPLGMLYGVSPDISIILLYTLYQPVFYATHNQSYPSVSCRILGLPPLIPLLQCVNRLDFEVCSVNNCQTEQGSLITLI